MINYYNENDERVASWLTELINVGAVAPGVVDTRGIEDVRPSDLRGFTQCHFFAGIGAWSYALRLAGWPDDRRVWTGSCPCQPFSTAGKGDGFDDPRHLWPHWFHLINQFRPETILGEQVASPDGLAWLDVVRSNVEGAGYAFGDADLCAAGVGAPHIRQRLYWVAHDYAAGRGEQRSAQLLDGERQAQWDDPDRRGTPLSTLGHAERPGREGGVETDVRGAGRGNEGRLAEQSGGVALPDPWRDLEWLYCRDGKYRPTEPGLLPLAHGAPARMVRLRGYGNAIVPQVAATFIKATGLI